MQHHRITFAAVALTAVLCGTVVPAFAGEYYDIILANRLIGRLRDPGESGSVSVRGSQVEKNIVEALSVEEVGDPNLWIDMEDDTPSIYIGKTFLVQILPGDVAGKDMKRKSLAKHWLAGFEQQFPRAEPVTKIGSTGANAAAASGGAGRPTAPKPVTVPEEDKELVARIEAMLAESRAMEAEDFEASEEVLATQAATLIWQDSQDADSGCVTQLEGAAKAIRSALNGLRHLRETSDEMFDQQKTLVAVTIVQRVRKSIAPTS
jgi:hypothetical protein